MHFNNEAIGAGSNADAREARDEIAQPCGVAWIGNHRQVRDLLQQRDARGIKSVAHRRLEGANAALAKNDVGIAMIEDNLCRAQQVGDGCDHAALQQDGQARSRRNFKQRVVLHAARTDLQNVGIIGDHRDVALRHHLGDDTQTGLFPRLGQQL